MNLKIKQEMEKKGKNQKNKSLSPEFKREHRNNLEKEISEQRDRIEKLAEIPLIEKPSKETMEKLDNFSRRLDVYESLGLSLKTEDYINRGNDLFYKGKYDVALEAYIKAIDLEPNNTLAWRGKNS